MCDLLFGRESRYDSKILRETCEDRSCRGCVLCRYLYDELVVHSFGRPTKDVHLEVTRHGSCLGVVDFSNTVHRLEIFAECEHRQDCTMCTILTYDR
jgi:hypothetical protein